MVDAASKACIFLISTLADLYAFLLVLRLILVWVRTDYFNRLTQLLLKLTDVFIRPLKRLVPNFKNFESACFLVVFVLEYLKLFLVGLLSFGLPHWGGLLLLAFAEILRLALNIFFYGIVIQIILSWIPYSYPDFYNFIYRLTAPILRPLRRLIPPIGGFDLSPLPALIGLQFITILLLDPLYAAGMRLSFG